MTMASNSTIVPLFLVSWVQLLAPDECFNEFFVKYNFFHGPCLKVLISKCLGYGIIVGSCIVKLPQIIKIFKSKSGEGISILSVTLELLAISAAWGYGARHQFPFSAYGESSFLAIQTSTIAFLVFVYGENLAQGLMYVSVYAAAMAFILSPAAPLSLISMLQAGNIFIVIISKAIQARANYSNGSTGQLSVVTVFLLFLGSVARIFTSIQETGDSMVVATYCVASLGNGMIASQCLYYWNAKPVQKSSSGTSESKKEL